MSTRLPLRAVVAAALGLLPFSLQANETVILRAGNRIEVERAHLDGDAWHLRLVGGGVVTLPASAVKRVSSAAADLPERAAPVVTSARSGAQAMPDRADAPPAVASELVRSAPPKLQSGPEGLKLPGGLGRFGGQGVQPAAAAFGAVGPGRSMTSQAQARSVLNDPFRQGAMRRVSGPSMGTVVRPRSGSGDPALSGGGMMSSGRLPRLKN